ncbi:SDR family oxidoreductase [Mycoplana sp. MJR14]|uniref:SDR family oxidoreductase n=1 Tax=Mycoplana sp. MJR14 TaxID=3032583 RepID=UPI0023DCD764|nr:SDR family oxidoreductase [Mycoplana sp. MJR14]MDF1635221.1 SDR family oxidoreductase [Mycoplana sp. MJR14]
MAILILGANGFIGSAVLARLERAGHELVGLGRDITAAKHRFPSVRWHRADLAGLNTPADWTPYLDGIDVVVNCAGALQDGQRDDVTATQRDAMLALYAAARQAGLRLLVQISARTDGAGELPFLATKAEADRALAASGLNHVILRPALVLGRNAHGGSALLRALAALPIVTPLVFADRRVETVSVEDGADCVRMAIDGSLPPGTDLYLAGDALDLSRLVALHRTWLGLPPAKTLALPDAVAGPVSRMADLAGRLGWRSPLRSTAMQVMAGGITAGGSRLDLPLQTAGETLARNPAGVQDLWFARLYLLKPVLVVTLALFWILSGLVPFSDLARAAAHFSPFMPQNAALGLTVATALLDITLGVLLLWRPTARMALVGQAALALAYLAGGTLLAPALWLDPLGPYVKVLPALALIPPTLAVLDER